MIRFLFRLLASAALAVAVIMAVIDATRTVAASALVLTPLAESWASVSPDTLASVQEFLAGRIHPAAWDPAMTSLLALPGFVVFAALAFLLYAVGRRPRRRAGRLAVEA